MILRARTIFSSIKIRYSVMHMAMILSICTMLGFISYRLIITTVSKQQIEKLSLIAASMANRIAHQMVTRDELLQQLVTGEIVARYSKTYEEKLLQEYLHQFASEFSMISYVNRQGIEEFKLVDGINRTNLSVITESKIFADVSWLPNQVVSTINLDQPSDTIPRLVSGFHRENYFGEFEGIIIVESRIDELLRPYREYKLGDSGFLTVIDGSGNVLLHPDSEVLYHPISFDGDTSGQLLSSALENKTGVGRATLGGRDGFVAYTPVSDGDWIVMATLPYDEFMADPIRYRNTFAELLILILLGGFLLSMYLSNEITKPIRRLIRSSRRIAHGDLTQRVDIETLDELGKLGASFNMMAGNLEQTRFRLDAEASMREKLIAELENKNAELERFTYTVSHDLKSPLVTVKGFIGLLKHDLADGNKASIEKDLQQIEEAADKMAELMEDLLELSRVGHTVQELKPVSLNDIFTEAVEHLKGPIKSNQASIHILPDMPNIMADGQRMIEVAQNLLENAIKFTIPGENPDVSVHAHIEEDRVICVVADRGIGIEPRHRHRIFDLFERLDQNQEGTGIGLALVKRIVEVHNGEVTVSSKGVGYGAEFRISLPVVHPENNKL